MKCPKCNSVESKVKKTLIYEGKTEGLKFGELKKRRRECKDCYEIFYSYEVTEDIFRKMRAPPKRRPLKTRAKIDLREARV